MKIIYACFLLLVSCAVFAQDKLVFATHTSPPLSLYLQEVLQAALRPYSIEVEVIEMPGSRVISQVNSGQVDGDLCRVENFKTVSDDDTSNYLIVNEPMVRTEIVLITLVQTEALQPITWESINEGKVAFLRGSKTIRKHLHIQNRVALSSNIQVLEMVINKRVGSAIMFASVAEKLFKLSPHLNEQLTIHQPAILSFNLFTYLNKKHVRLIPKIEYSLKQLKMNGFIANSANKYQVLAPGPLAL